MTASAELHSTPSTAHEAIRRIFADGFATGGTAGTETTVAVAGGLFGLALAVGAASVSQGLMALHRAVGEGLLCVTGQRRAPQRGGAPEGGRHGIAVAPGSAFGGGREGHLRLCFAESLPQGLDFPQKRFAIRIERLKFDKALLERALLDLKPLEAR